MPDVSDFDAAPEHEIDVSDFDRPPDESAQDVSDFDHPHAGIVDALKTALSHGPLTDAADFAVAHPGQAASIAGGVGLTAATAGLGLVPATIAGTVGGLGLDVGSRYLEGDPHPVHLGEYGKDQATAMMVGLLTAALTKNYGKAIQYAGAVGGGALTRKLLGGDATDMFGMVLDAAMPGLHSAVGGLHRATRPGSEATHVRQLYGSEQLEHAMSLDDIHPIPADGPLLKPDILPPQTPSQRMVDLARMIYERPAAMAMKAQNQWVRDIGNRLHHYALKGRHLKTALDREEAKLTANPDEKIDMIGSTLLQAGKTRAGFLNDETLIHAQDAGDFWDATGRLGERARYYNPDAPRLPGYFGPVIKREFAEAALNPGVDPITAAQMVAPTGASRKDVSAHERKTRFNPGTDEADQSRLIRLWRLKNELGMKAALVFGPKPKPGSGQAVGEFGDILNDRIARVLEDKRNGLLSARDERAFHEALLSIKRIYHQTPPTIWERIGGRVGQGLSNVLLARSAPRQLGQAATNVAHVGVGNTIEGIVQSFRDPDYIPFLESGGGGGSSMAEHVHQMYGSGKPTATSGLMSGVERLLRLRLAAGSQPYYLQTMREAEAWRAAHGADEAMPGGLVRRMREMDIDPTGPYTPTASGARDAHTRLVSDMQLLSNETGQSSDLMIGTPGRRTGLQFLPYLLGSAGLAREHYLDPIVSGVRNRDMSELRLASDRIGRLIPAAILAETAGRGIYDAMSGNVPLSNNEGEQDKYVDELPGQIAERALQTHLGIGASVGSDFLRGFGHAPADEEKDTLGNLGWRGLKGVSSAVGGFAPPWAEIAVHQDPAKLASMVTSLVAPRFASGLALASPVLNKLGQAVTAESADIPQMERPEAFSLGQTPVYPPGRPPLIPGNIDLHNRPVSQNPDGSFSTVNSMSFGTDQGEALVPGVARDGSGIISPQAAKDQYGMTGEHLGIFENPDAADVYAQRLHEEQAREYGPQMGETGPNATDYPAPPMVSPEPSAMPGVNNYGMARPPVSDLMGPPEPPPEERYLYGVYNYPQ